MATMIDQAIAGAGSAADAEAEGRLPKASPGVGFARGAALPGAQWSGDERSETPRNGGPGSADRGGAGPAAPSAATETDPEVLDRPVRRRFTAEYKHRILRQADACPRGEVAALLRREGLYSSHLAGWRRERDRVEKKTLSPKKRGPKVTQAPALLAECQRLRRENVRLERRLHQAEVCLEIQKKASELLGIPLNSPNSEETD